MCQQIKFGETSEQFLNSCTLTYRPYVDFVCSLNSTCWSQLIFNPSTIRILVSKDIVSTHWFAFRMFGLVWDEEVHHNSDPAKNLHWMKGLLCKIWTFLFFGWCSICLRFSLGPKSLCKLHISNNYFFRVFLEASIFLLVAFHIAVLHTKKAS